MKRILQVLLLVSVSIAAYIGFMFYANMLSINTPANLQDKDLYIPPGATLNDVVDSLLVKGQKKWVTLMSMLKKVII